jgi:hypothetical protein
MLTDVIDRLHQTTTDYCKRRRDRPSVDLQTMSARGCMSARVTHGLREVVMTSLNGKWLWLSIVVIGCGGSQAAAPGASTALGNEAKEKTERTSSGPMNAVKKTGSTSVTATLGPGGGTLELTEGPRVVVPAGAVQGAQDFVLNLAPKTTAFANKESEKALGPTFSFAPPLDASDNGGIEVSFPLGSMPDGWGDPSIAYEAEEGAEIMGEDSTRTKWQYERAKYSGGRVTATLPQANGLRMAFTLTNLEAQ